MEADLPVLSPRQKRFRRYAAFGHTLTEAAKCADNEGWETDLCPSIEAELRERIKTEVYERTRAELAADQPVEPVLSGTNHDIFAEPDVPAPAPASGTSEARAEVRAEPVLSGTFHDVSDEPDAIDLVITRINGTAVRRAAGAAPTMTNHDFPGLARRRRAAGTS